MNTDQETYINDNVQALIGLMRELEPYERCSQEWFRVLFRWCVVMEQVLGAPDVDVAGVFDSPAVPDFVELFL